MINVIARFGLAGLINTAIGFAIIATLDAGFGVTPSLANVAGYAVGMAVGMVLNRGFVFRSERGFSTVAPRYVIAALGAFALNQGILRGAGAALGGGALQHMTAQGLAMAAYSVALFALCRVWVFKTSATS